MDWRRDPRFWQAAGILAIVWLCGFTERIVSVEEGRLAPLWLGDLAGLVGALLLGGAGRFVLRDIFIPTSVRRMLLVAWLLFVSYSISDVLDEFAFPADNPILGKRQPLHRAIEILLWSSGFLLAIAGLFAALLDSANARRAARAERERGDASTRETERTQEQLALFSHAIEQATESFVLMDLAGKLIYANKAFEDLLEMPPGSAVGKTAAELIATHAANPAVMVEQALEHGSWSGEVEARRANGAAFCASVTLVLFRDKSGVPAGIAGLARDVSEQRRLQSALRDSEDRYRMIAENATDLISTHTRDSEWLYVSPSVTAILGYTPEELLGRPAYDIMDPAQADALNDLDPADFLDPQPDPIPITLRHKDGRLIHCETRVRTLTPAHAEEPQMLAMTRDVSGRLREEEERRQLEKKLQRAQRHESLALLAGGVAHDFNNLLLVILANSDLLAIRLGANPAAENYIPKIQTAAERAAELTRQMLMYTGQGEAAIQPIDLGKTVQDMAALLEASVPTGVTIHTDCPPAAPVMLGDITEIRQVILNLITNAAEAIGAGQGDIRISTGLQDCTREFLDGCIAHDHLPEGRYAYIEVNDTGEGIDLKTQERMFDPFFTTKFQGRGLGLAAVLGIVRRHRGTMCIHSVPGAGATIRALFNTEPQIRTPQAAN
jgi:two-component system cell cycle sensor histidine kinase/response regulator CckA